MNRTFKTTLTLIALGATALGLSAQSALKIYTVDMQKLYVGYFKTDSEEAKVKAQQQKAQEEFERRVKELNSLGEQYKETVEQSKNAMLTPEARTKAEADATKQLDGLQQRNGDIQKFKGEAENQIRQAAYNVKSLLVDEILKKVTELGKSKGATVVIDRGSGVVYMDPSIDLTDEAMALINKDRPASSTTPAPAASTGAATAPATTADAMVTVPGLAPKK